METIEYIKLMGDHGMSNYRKLFLILFMHSLFYLDF